MHGRCEKDCQDGRSLKPLHLGTGRVVSDRQSFEDLVLSTRLPNMCNTGQGLEKTTFDCKDVLASEVMSEGGGSGESWNLAPRLE